MSSIELQRLLGQHPSSDEFTKAISELSSLANVGIPTPEVKSYPDAVYFNYFPLGLSLLFKPVNGYKPCTGLTLSELRSDDLVLDGIDMYNVNKTEKTPSSKTKLAYSTYPVETFSIALISTPEKPRAAFAAITHNTTGKEFVEIMGEPDRKGGGAGPSSGSIGIWCEWSKDGIMVEFGGEESRGPQAWERGKDAMWKVISMFPPSNE